MDIFEDIIMHFVMRARRADDEIAITLKGHLLSEYLLDRILESRFEPNKTKDLTYARKLSLLEKHSFLPEELLLNLRLLNSFRNRLSHELDVSIGKEEMVFHKPNREVLKIKMKKVMYPERYYLRLLCHGVLIGLRNHMLLFLKVDPRKESIFA